MPRAVMIRSVRFLELAKLLQDNTNANIVYTISYTVFLVLSTGL